MQLKLFNLDLFRRQAKERVRRRRLQVVVNHTGIQLTIQFTNRAYVTKLLSDRKVQNELMQYANYLTRNSDTAMDLFQDTMLKAIEHSDKFKSGNIKAWCTTIMKNQHNNNVSRKKVVVYQEDLPQHGFEDYTAQMEFAQTDIKNVLSKLNGNQKRVVELKIQEYTNKEIAEELNIKIAQVNNLKCLATKIIKKSGFHQ